MGSSKSRTWASSALERTNPASTGRRGYRPITLLTRYISGGSPGASPPLFVQRTLGVNVVVALKNSLPSLRPTNSS